MKQQFKFVVSHSLEPAPEGDSGKLGPFEPYSWILSQKQEQKRCLLWCCRNSGSRSGDVRLEAAVIGWPNGGEICQVVKPGCKRRKLVSPHLRSRTREALISKFAGITKKTYVSLCRACAIQARSIHNASLFEVT